MENLLDVIDECMDREELVKYRELFNKFDNFSKNRKRYILKELYKLLDKENTKQINEDLMDTCRSEGHIFTPWERSACPTIRFYPNQYGKTETHDCITFFWSRKCKRCGYSQLQEQEPEELVTKRLIKIKEEKIKELNNEIDELKNSYISNK